MPRRRSRISARVGRSRACSPPTSCFFQGSRADARLLLPRRGASVLVPRRLVPLPAPIRRRSAHPPGIERWGRILCAHRGLRIRAGDRASVRQPREETAPAAVVTFLNGLALLAAAVGVVVVLMFLFGRWR